MNQFIDQRSLCGRRLAVEQLHYPLPQFLLIKKLMILNFNIVAQGNKKFPRISVLLLNKIL